MTYVGAVPTTGDFKVLDSITTSSATTFNLRQGGVAVYPQSANHCLVVLNGVLQTAGSSFNIVNDTIVFASSLASSDVINQILVLGNVNDIGVPSDDTVSTAKIQSTAVTDAKISAMAASKLTGTVAQANIADQAINEAKMQISNAPTNGYALTAQSGNTGGLTWAEMSSGLWVKLGDTSYSGNTASVTFDNVFSSTYRVYKVFMKTATSNSDEQLQIKFRSGASGSNADIDESDYSHHRTYNGIDTDNNNSSNGYSNSKGNQLFVLAAQGHMGSNHKPMTIDMTIQDPGDHASNNSGRTQIVYNASFYNNANLTYHEVGSCFYDDGTDPTGIKFSMTAGSFGYGNILLYGLKP